jgi:hypothetical protein
VSQGCGGALAELLGRDAEWGVLDDVCDLITVGADDHGVQMPDVSLDSMRFAGFFMAEGAERKVAATAKRVEDGALGGGGEGGVRAVKRGDGGVDGGVIRR